MIGARADDASRDAASSAGQAPIALTLGDPAGIGPEIALKAWAQGAARGVVAYGDPAMIEARARMLGLDVLVQPLATIEEAPQAPPGRFLLVAVPLANPVSAGIADPANGAGVIASIERAAGDIASGKARALVTCPIAKHVLYAAGFAHPGHTEFLGELAAHHWPHRPSRPVMMLASPQLRVVPLTIHVPIADVPRLVTRNLILETARITWTALHAQFAIAAPRIAICGLNPHAGERGSIGREDQDVIAPAIATLQREGLGVSGPHSADTLFHAAARAKYDAAICMYHDQALIPIKTLAFDEGVNVTLGLPFIRTSPDHGTAFDIAARGIANPSSLIAAIQLASTLQPLPQPAA